MAETKLQGAIGAGCILVEPGSKTQWIGKIETGDTDRKRWQVGSRTNMMAECCHRRAVRRLWRQQPRHAGGESPDQAASPSCA